jgi:hypothetical protein
MDHKPIIIWLPSMRDMLKGFVTVFVLATLIVIFMMFVMPIIFYYADMWRAYWH